MKPLFKTCLKIVCWTAGVIAALLVVLQIVLSSGLVTKLVNNFAADYVEGELSFGKVSANVFRHFPAVSVNLDDALLTYPHERYAAAEAAHPDIMLLRGGRGTEVDTLASFRRLSVSVNPWPLICGTIDLRHIVLESPRAFVKIYDDGSSNLDILPLSSDEDSVDELPDGETESSGLPSIRLKQLSLTGHPDIVFCDTRDTLHARLMLKDMSLNGRISTSDPVTSKGSFSIDSLRVFGRLGADTLLFGLDNATVKAHKRKVSIDAQARLHALTNSFGRLSLPVSISAQADFPRDSITTLNLHSFKLSAAGIPLKASGHFEFHHDGIMMDAGAAIENCKLQPVIANFGPAFWEGASRLETDASLTLTAMAQGYYSSENNLMPEVAAELLIPKASVVHPDYDVEGSLELDITADADANGPLNAIVHALSLQVPGFAFDAQADASDLMGADPAFGFDADFSADLAALCGYLPEDSGYEARGSIEACFFGNILSSQMNMADFAKADISGLLLSDSLFVKSASDTLTATISGVEVKLAARKNTNDDSAAADERMLALSFAVDSLSADIHGEMLASLSSLELVAQNSADFLDERKKADFYPFMGSLSVDMVRLKDSDSCMVSLMNSRNSFRISPKQGNRDIPVLKLSSNNGGLIVKGETMRAGLRDFSLEATAAMNTFEKRLRRNAVLDSLARVYPDTPRDSLFAKAFRRNARAVPEWMQDEELLKQDINFNLSEDMKKYYRDWDINGSIALSRGFLATPRFPLRNSVRDFKGSFDNDRIDLESFLLKSGSSDISASGSVTGLRRAVLGHGIINLNLKVNSDLLQVNELFNAYDAGCKLDSLTVAGFNELDDDSYQDACAGLVGEDVPPVASLIAVPGNVNANIVLEANNIVYSGLDIDWMESDIVVKERCLQISNTVATSNMGDIYFEAFYSTKSMQNIRCGFNLNLADITADKVIELVPQVDSILPMLKSFYGNLDCTVAATASMDENMNILIPTVTGVTRIVGKDLEIRNDKDIKKIAKVLMFRNKNIIHVDNMSVEGLLQDSQLEIFPFMLSVDRYKLALSGVQNMDSSFKYHVSVIKSPLLFKFGVNITGDFDDWKFRIGKPKYRNVSKIPAFTKVIDQTTLSLTNSIHNIFEKGVDAAVAENNTQQAISDFKQSTGYVPVTEEPLDSLDGDENALFEQMEAMEKAVSELGYDLDSLTPAIFDSLDEQTRASMEAAGVSREFLVKREEESQDADE